MSVKVAITNTGGDVHYCDMYTSLNSCVCIFEWNAHILSSRFCAGRYHNVGDYIGVVL
jgi:hypothetical protein